MKQLMKPERLLVISHILSMAFGLAGLLIVIPNPKLIASLPPFGQSFFGWSMATGGVLYMVLGTAAVAVYAKRAFGLWHWLSFMLPAIFISLGSELLGTSTGFPFGHYRYLSGLGYKIAGLVPFTIPLSWFYLGFSAYILARAALATKSIPSWLKYTGAIFFGSLLLTSWDFVLDPAMSQAKYTFWVWEQPGAFFGMPYQNFAGWMGTGIVFMSVATIFWQAKPLKLTNKDLELPLIMYLSNFGFAMILSLAEGIYIPIFLGIILGVVPALVLYWVAKTASEPVSEAQDNLTVNSGVVALESVTIPVSSVE